MAFSFILHNSSTKHNFLLHLKGLLPSNILQNKFSQLRIRTQTLLNSTHITPVFFFLQSYYWQTVSSQFCSMHAHQEDKQVRAKASEWISRKVNYIQRMTRFSGHSIPWLWLMGPRTRQRESPRFISTSVSSHSRRYYIGPHLQSIFQSWTLNRKEGVQEKSRKALGKNHMLKLRMPYSL